MSFRRRCGHCLICAAAVLLALDTAAADDGLFKVKKVYSGNRIKLQAGTDREKDFRAVYIGVDAPQRGKPFFDMCRAANSSLVEKRTVRVESDAVAADDDGRKLLYVYDGPVFVNAEIIKNGFGLVAPPDGNVRYRELLLSLQQEARKNRRGLWAYEDQNDEPYYVGSKSAKIFHRPTCSHVKGLAFEDRLIFRTKADALSRNYRQDWRCCPLFKKPE